MSQIPETDHAEGLGTKVVGLFWHADRNALSLQLKIKVNNCVNTKREILRHTASVFYPLGLFNPVILKGKLFL